MFRRTTAVILASGVFGGVVGSLATAATQSSADPRAIAAAVVQVSDLNAENELATIKESLIQICRATPHTVKFLCTH